MAMMAAVVILSISHIEASEIKDPCAMSHWVIEAIPNASFV